MAAYLCIYIPTHSQELFNNSYNSRQSVLAQKNTRGSILSADGKILAQTVVDEEGNEQRVYPYANEFADIVGYSTKGGVGAGKLGRLTIWSNTSASVSEQAQNAAAGKKNPGDNFITTLDSELQKAAYDAMGIYQGAVIAMKPSTGRILAMVSKPDFDPNEIADIWEEVTEDTEGSVLLNRATQGLYPPGSTFKIVTALEYIRENPDTWENYSYQCTGSYTYGDSTIRCFHGSQHGQVDFARSFAKSCNASFANMGMSLDLVQFSFHLEETCSSNQPLPVDLTYSESRVQLTADSEDADMIQTVIGQGKTQLRPFIFA